MEGKFIGKGSFGYVTPLVIDPVSNLVVAIKHMPIPKSDDEKRRTKLLKELEILQKIAYHRQCPCIIHFYGPLRNPNEAELCFVLEFMSMDLEKAYGNFHKIKPFKKKMLNIFLRRVTYDISVALEFMRNHNLSHNDLKPTNILLNEKGRLLLTDFSESTDIKKEKGFENISDLGTLYYWPPECMESNGTCSSERFHLWALGIILLEISIGKHPYPLGKDKIELNSYIKSWRANIPPAKVSKQSARFIRRLFRKGRTDKVISYGDFRKSRYLTFMTSDPSYQEIDLFRSIISFG